MSLEKEKEVVKGHRNIIKRWYVKYKLWLREKNESSVTFENESEKRIYDFVIKLIKNPKSDAFKCESEKGNFNIYFIRKEEYLISFNKQILKITASNYSENILLFDKAYDHLCELYMDKIFAKRDKFIKDVEVTDNKILNEMLNSSVIKNESDK